MAEVDRVATADYGIALAMMMEHAGRAVAAAARRMLGPLAGRRVVVLCGPGNNGGGGLCGARHLAIAGAAVTVALTREPAPGGVAAQQARIVCAMGIEPLPMAGATEGEVVGGAAAPAGGGAGAGDAETGASGAAPGVPPSVSGLAARLAECDLAVDALLGYNQHGAPRGAVRAAVAALDRAGAPVLALDLPTGVDPDSGAVAEPCVRTAATVTLALPKTGLLTERGRAAVGRLWVATLGLPEGAFRDAGVTGALPEFEADGLVEVG